MVQSSSRDGRISHSKREQKQTSSSDSRVINPYHPFRIQLLLQLTAAPSDQVNPSLQRPAGSSGVGEGAAIRPSGYISLIFCTGYTMTVPNDRNSDTCTVTWAHYPGRVAGCLISKAINDSYSYPTDQPQSSGPTLTSDIRAHEGNIPAAPARTPHH